VIQKNYLDTVVRNWKRYFLDKASELSGPKPAVSLLRKKNLAMYWASGCLTGEELAQQLVSDHFSQIIEQTAGWLYESVLEAAGGEIGMTKVEDKKSDGRKGLDFIQEYHGERRLIDLAAGGSTKNGAARAKSINDMRDNAQFWGSQHNDNPLGKQPLETVKVWAMARGTPKNQINPRGILEVRGEAMWSYLGLGPDFVNQLNSELGRQHVSNSELNETKQLAQDAIQSFLRFSGYTYGPAETIDYNALVSDYP